MYTPDLPNFNECPDKVVDFKCKQCDKVSALMGKASMLERVTHTYCKYCGGPAVRFRNLNPFELARIKEFVHRRLGIK